MSDMAVFLVDDDASVRDSLSLLLSLKGLRTQVFASAEQFLATYRREWRGCLLTDLRMPGMSGLELQSTLAKQGFELPIIVLTAHGDIATTRAALKSGALDFLEKPVDDEVLVDVLRNALHLDNERRSSSLAREVSLSRVERLTPREREVFDLLAEGLQNRDIAIHLQISPRTVEVYKARIMEKLQCRNLADAIKLNLSLPPAAKTPRVTQ
jgi:two-component system, LuxR family, response regulator FixJ